MLDLLVSGLSEMLALAMQGFVSLLLPILSFTPDMFNKAFPFAASSFAVLQSIAVGIVLLLAAFQTLPYLAGQQSSRSSPIRIGLSVIIAVFAIFYGNYLLQGIMDIAQVPYTTLLHTSSGVLDAATNPDEANCLGAAFVILHDATYGISGPLYLFLMVLVGWSFIKLLLEAVERYVILFVLLYLSPLAASAIAAESTVGVAKKFFQMFLSQCLLLILNVWAMKMATSFFIGLPLIDFKVVGLLMAYAFMRIAARMDSYLNQIGMSAAITGAGLGQELFASGAMIMSKLSGGGKSGAGAGSGAAGGTGGGIIGGLKSTLPAISPLAAMGNAAGNQLKAGLSAGMKTMKQAKDGQLGTDSFSNRLKQNFADASFGAKLESEKYGGFSKSMSQNSATDSVIADAMSNGQFSDKGFDAVANHASLAEQVLGAATGEIDNPNVAQAILKGTGLDQDRNGAELSAALAGNSGAENLTSKLDQDGLHAAYDLNGQSHDWNIKNQAQYDALSASEKAGYTAMQSAGGGMLYAQHKSQRIPSEMEIAKANAVNQAVAFAQNPTNNPLTPEQIATIGASGSANMTGDFYRAMSSNGTSVSMDDSNHGQCADLMGVNSAVLSAAGVSNAHVKELTTDMNSASGSMVSSFQMDGNGTALTYTDSNGQSRRMSIVTDAGITNASASAGVDRGAYESELSSQGYRKAVVNGESYMVLDQTPQQAAAPRIEQFAQDPSSNPLPAGDIVAISASGSNNMAGIDRKSVV